MQKVVIRATNSYLIQCSLLEIYGVDTARNMTPLLNYALNAEMLRSEPRGAYQFACVRDAVVRQWIHCPMSLSCKAHRAPLWTADINLLRQRSGGV